MVVLAFVVLMSGGMAAVFIMVPAREGPTVTGWTIAVCGVIALLATMWFVRLVVTAVSDYRHGIHRGPAKVSGWFHVWFGAAVAVGGIVCTSLTYQSAVAAGGGTWTLFWGMIAWGTIEALIGFGKVRRSQPESA